MVITVLGILAAIALPRFFPQTEKGRVSEAISILSAIRQGEEAFFLERGTYLPIAAGAPEADWNQIGIENPNTGNTYFTYDVNTGAGGAQFTAHATRAAVVDPGGNAGSVIGLSQNGDYCGDHPNTPPNRGAAAPAACPN